jgi:acyl-CoA thioester hydrolase
VAAQDQDHPFGAATETTIRVRYAETDQMGIVYYANYFVWFELGRVELLRERGLSYRDFEEQEDCFIVVADARCTYRAPARYDDVITIRTRVTGLRSRVVTFGYEIMTDSDRLLATGETTHVITDRSGKPRALPESYRAILAPSGEQA